MKLLPLILLALLFTMSSCKSEYEERLAQGKQLKSKMAALERSKVYIDLYDTESQVDEIRREIILLSKVSGNEELFLKEVFEN